MDLLLVLDNHVVREGMTYTLCRNTARCTNSSLWAPGEVSLSVTNALFYHFFQSTPRLKTTGKLKRKKRQYKSKQVNYRRKNKMQTLCHYLKSIFLFFALC